MTAVVTPRLAICLPYYKNPGMLAHQMSVWSRYPEAVTAQIEIVVVDDGSPAPFEAMRVARPDGLPPFRLYRVLEDRPWHQHGARNLAATEADADWLLLTDMDHVMPAESVAALLERLPESDCNAVYRFRRVDAPRMRPTVNDRGEPKLHVNTFAIRKAYFWEIGGYDEDCVGYGTDGYFRNRLTAKRPFLDLQDITIIRYAREVIPDASTRPDDPMDPKVFRNQGRRGVETRKRLTEKAVTGMGPTVLAFPWERVV